MKPQERNILIALAFVALAAWAVKKGYLNLSPSPYKPKGFDEAERIAREGGAPAATSESSEYYKNIAAQVIEAYEGTWVGQTSIVAVNNKILNMSDTDTIKVARAYTTIPNNEGYESMRALISAEYFVWGTTGSSTRTEVVNKLTRLGV